MLKSLGFCAAFTLLLPLVLSAAPAQTAGSLALAPTMANLCATLPEATVRSLTGVPTGGFSHEATRFSATHSRCVYGVTDGDLVLEFYRFPTSAEAVAQMAKLGRLTRSAYDTTSPFNTDQVNTYETMRANEGDTRMIDASGFAARHGSTIVGLGLDRPQSDFSPAGVNRLERAVLILAGARLISWPTENLCARVPVAALQTLVTLGPARETEENKSEGGHSTCIYTFAPLSSIDETEQSQVLLDSFLFLNQAEAEAAVSAKLTSAPRLQTADAGDLILNVDDANRNVVYAFHQGVVGIASVDSGEAAARAHPSYAAHLEQAALLAAGARLVSSPALAAIPAPVPVTQMAEAKQSLLWFFSHYWFLVVILLIILWLVRGRLRRRNLLEHGLPGQARVNSISDTGVTINNDPMIRLHVTITPQTGAPYEASESKVVSRLEAPASMIGQVLEVRIDPKNPQRFAFL